MTNNPHRTSALSPGIPAMKNKTPHKPSTPVLHVDESVSVEEQIARRAHELYEQRGHEHGSDLSDWFRAEREVNGWHQQRLQTARLQRRALA